MSNVQRRDFQIRRQGVADQHEGGRQLPPGAVPRQGICRAASPPGCYGPLRALGRPFDLVEGEKPLKPLGSSFQFQAPARVTPSQTMRAHVRALAICGRARSPITPPRERVRRTLTWEGDGQEPACKGRNPEPPPPTFRRTAPVVFFSWSSRETPASLNSLTPVEGFGHTRRPQAR